MGHLVFFILHFIAAVYVGKILLMFTIPLHIIYSAIENNSRRNNQIQAPENYQPKSIRSRFSQEKTKKVHPAMYVVYGFFGFLGAIPIAYFVFILLKIIYQLITGK